MKKLFFWGFALLFITQISSCSLDQQPSGLTAVQPEEAGVSADRLLHLDAMVDESIENGEMPGAVVFVARNGNVVYHKAFGVADTETGRKFQKDDLFRIASQSKAITATAVMILWEEGKFQLDDPVSKFIPEFKDPQVLVDFNAADTSYTTRAADNEITIRHLLTHTSGLGYGVIDGDDRIKLIYEKAGITDLFTTEPVTIEENIKKLARLPLHHDPGERFTYSEGLDVMGYFIEIISGMPFDRFLKERIFDPLGMDDTGFYLPEEKANRLVPLQTKENGEWVKHPVTFYDPDYPIKGAKTFFSGGAGLTSSVTDYAAFLQMYLNRGEYNGARILSPATVDLILTDQTGGASLWGNTARYYGLAFGGTNQEGWLAGGNGYEGAFDWAGYFNTQYFADPQTGLIGMIFKQTQPLNEPIPNNNRWKYRQIIGASVVD